MFNHIPVLPNEVLKSFSKLKKGSLIIDGTLGGGGHSKILLENGFNIIGIDRDKEAISEAEKFLAGFKNIKFIHGNFSDLENILKKLKIKKVNGILLDLGVSTYQLENEKRGFGFSGKLDMRMNTEDKITAEKILNKYSYEKLAEILYKYGEKNFSKEITENIIEYRKEKKIKTGEQLLEIISEVIPEGYKKSREHHWATPTFRALRIEVNKDFENLEKFLDIFSDYLEKEGILSIITFHSMEEKILKMKFQILKKQKKIKILTRYGIEATKKEIDKNPKAKRAKLWIVQKK